MGSRCAILLLCGFLLTCESTTGPESDEWSFEPQPYQNLVSSDFVKTILKEDGSLYSWGHGFMGTLGMGDLDDRPRPTRIPRLSHVISYAQEWGAALALTEDGSLYIWGRWMPSSLGYEPIRSPVKVAQVVGGIFLGGGGDIVDAEGSLWAVEPNWANPSHTSGPQRVPLPKAVSQVSGGLGLYRDGTLFERHPSEPERGGLVGGIDGVVAVQNAWNYRTVVLKADGSVWAWGQGEEGVLGDGEMANSAVPVRVEGLEGVRKISCSRNFCLALEEDGSVWYWGFLRIEGDGDRAHQPVPALVPGITGALDIDADAESLIRTSGGRVFVFDRETMEVGEVPFQW